MIKSNFWTRAIDGIQQGQADYILSGLDHATPVFRQRVINKQSRFVVYVSDLDDFSTRDYGYDRGGEVIESKELLGYWSMWIRKTD